MSGCQKLTQLNLVWHRMLYSSTRMAAVGIKGLMLAGRYELSMILYCDYLGTKCEHLVAEWCWWLWSHRVPAGQSEGVSTVY